MGRKGGASNRCVFGDGLSGIVLYRFPGQDSEFLLVNQDGTGAEPRASIILDSTEASAQARKSPFQRGNQVDCSHCRRWANLGVTENGGAPTGCAVVHGVSPFSALRVRVAFRH